MFNFRRKKEKPLEESTDAKFIRTLLIELDLINVKNLMETAEIIKERKDREQAEKVLRYIQPYIIKALQEGETYGRSEFIEVGINSYEYRIPVILYNELHKFGIEISYSMDGYEYFTNQSDLPLGSPRGWYKKMALEFRMYKPKGE